nr:hypothetical protein [Burkholderia sp. BCC0405]
MMTVPFTVQSGVSTAWLNVAIQWIGPTAPFWSDVSPDAENGSPFGFVGKPSAREAVTANAGAAETAVTTTAAASDAI